MKTSTGYQLMQLSWQRDQLKAQIDQAKNGRHNAHPDDRMALDDAERDLAYFEAELRRVNRKIEKLEEEEKPRWKPDQPQERT